MLYTERMTTQTQTFALGTVVLRAINDYLSIGLASDVQVKSVKVNDRYDPNYRPLRDYAPDRDTDPSGWWEAYKAHNYEGNATHSVTLSYLDEKGTRWLAEYGVNVHTGVIELWAD